MGYSIQELYYSVPQTEIQNENILKISRNILVAGIPMFLTFYRAFSHIPQPYKKRATFNNMEKITS